MQWVGLNKSLIPKPKIKKLIKCADCSISIIKGKNRTRCIPCQEKYTNKLRSERKRLKRKNEKNI